VREFVGLYLANSLANSKRCVRGTGYVELTDKGYVKTKHCFVRIRVTSSKMQNLVRQLQNIFNSNQLSVIIFLLFIPDGCSLFTHDCSLFIDD